MNGRVQEFLISRARKIERALVRKSWTRVHLAELTGYDERTIRNVLGAKPVRDQTIIDICQALGIEPDLEDSSEYVEVADAEYGEYPRGPYRRYEGGYFAYRRSFNSLARLMRTCVEIEWAEDEGLIFREHSQFQAGRRQVDNSQSGRVHISQTTGLMHLVTCVEGAVRTHHPHKDDGRCRGDAGSRPNADRPGWALYAGVLIHRTRQIEGLRSGEALDHGRSDRRERRRV